MAFTAINAPGHMATGSGAGGGDGGGGKRPEKRRSGHQASETPSQRERLLERVREVLKNLITRRFEVDSNGKLNVPLTSMDRNWLTQLLAAYKEGKNGGLAVSAMFKNILKNPPAAIWMDKLTSGGNFQLVTEPRLAVSDTLGAPSEEPSLNIGGGNNYLPCLAASGVAGAEINSVKCDKCQTRGNSYFSHCITVEGLFRGACLECAVDNHYESCSFSGHQPTPRNTRNRQDYDTQMQEVLEESQTTHAPQDALAEAHRNRPLLPMYDQRGRPLFQPLPFSTPAPLRSPAGNAYPHDNRYPIDFSRSLPAMGAGSRHGMVAVNFNYPSGASRAQQQQHIQTALRNILDNFTAVWDASEVFNPGNIRSRQDEDQEDPDAEMS